MYEMTFLFYELQMLKGAKYFFQLSLFPPKYVKYKKMFSEAIPHKNDSLSY